MKYLYSLLYSTATVVAFPSYMSQHIRNLQPGDALQKRAIDSASETNCGPTPCAIFSEEEQLVSIEGEYAFVPPGPGDLRGPCPGLNAAANHNYSESL